MPEISRFFGIIIQMYFSDHSPPHFHAVYQEYSIAICIEDGVVIKGNLPPRIFGFVQEWRMLHTKELMENWQHAQTDGRFTKVPPLE